jgi:hypothetical protein
MQGIYHQSLTGNQGQLGPFDPSIIIKTHLRNLYIYSCDIFLILILYPAKLLTIVFAAQRS